MTDSGATRLITDAQGQTLRSIGAFRLSDDRGLDQLCTEVRMRVGSHQANDVVIKDPSVSRFHLELESTQHGIRLRDLGSTNGTWVNGLRVASCTLPNQAQIKLGDHQLKFVVTDERRHLEQSGQSEFHGLVGTTPVMRELFATLERAAATDVTVLLEGESGTGKERVAEALHQASDRAGKPFVVVDCASLPSDLIESELFGHERGAFTGAANRRDGQFREADGGTIFLDELGELPLELQPKLLRVLESRQVRRVGGNTSDPVDVRVIAATNRDLRREVNQGAFREDLYYRVAVVNLRMAPLRERRSDIRPLAEHFIRSMCRRQPGRAEQVLAGMTTQHWSKIEQLPWTGNVRELRNFVERTLALSDEQTFQASLFDRPAGQVPGAVGEAAAEAATHTLDVPFRDAKAEIIANFERGYLMGQLAAHDNNISAAARASGLDRMNFKRLLKKYR